MKVGVDARNVTDRTSGLNDYVRNLLAELSKQDLELVVYCQEAYAANLPGIARKDLRFVPFDTAFLSGKNATYEKDRFAAVIERDRPDAFHNPFGFGLPPALSIPTVLTVHDLIPLRGEDELSGQQVATFKESFGRSLDNADSVVCITEFTKRELSALCPDFPASKVSVIHNGFDSLTPPKSHDQFLKLQKRYAITEPFVLYVGSGTRRKNLPMLAESFLKIADSIPHQLVLISKFDRPETLKTRKVVESAFAAAGKSDRLVCTGYVDDVDKTVLLNEADFFVYPSRYEGFGLPLLEAMSLGRAVVCSDILPFREVAGDAAEFTDPGDPDSIAAAMRRLATDETRRRELERLGKRRTKRFSWEKMGREYLQAYRTLAR
ncbi:MAG TPA: glycosyltransferase family 1 protein [Patescibacteria group bacterium]|jgi:glycosyltransferase involved in cell wall biosynthesis